MARANFSKKTVDTLQMRAAFICSNPECRALTIAPLEKDENHYTYAGEAAHITAAAPDGPRYDATLTDEQRADITNGIFLCSVCADVVDKNDGLGYTVDQLKEWKQQHEKWIRENLNKNIADQKPSEIAGEIKVSGKGTVVGLHAKKAVKLMPGTKVDVSGEGDLTGIKIGQ